MRARQLLFLLLIAVPACAADQLSKFAAYTALTYRPADRSAFEQFANGARGIVKPPQVVSERFWDFQYSENPGAAFSFLAGAKASFRGPFFIVIALIIIPLLLRFYLAARPDERIRRFAVPLILGGSLGNLIDRLRLGYVIDFVHWHLGETMDWPIFNVADAAISIGVVLLLAESLRSHRSQAAAR